MSDDFESFLASCPPFDSLDARALTEAARAARIEHYTAGDLIVDAFADPTVDIFVVISGEVNLWFDPNRINDAADERFTTGNVFGFSAALTERAVGPRVVANTPVSIARIAASLVAAAFSSKTGARFLAEHVSNAFRRASGPPTYTIVDDLMVSDPLVVHPATPVGEVARQMTQRGLQCAVVGSDHGQFGLITDSVLRQRVIVDGAPPETPAHTMVQYPAPTTALGESAAEALIDMLDADAEFLVVTDRSGTARGVVAARDFVVSPTTAGVSVHEQIRRAGSVEELIERSHLVPSMLTDVMGRGLASTRVIAVYSAIVDTVIRRSIGLVFERHPQLTVNAFTWLSLGSNGRREAVLSSDVDAAVAFDDTVAKAAVARYRAAFAEVNAVIAQAGISIDRNGANAPRARFSRTNSEWHVAATRWLAAPHKDNAAIMTSLLVDGRPIHGDPGLPEVTKVFGDFRRHPATMELLLKASLSHRAKLRSIRDVLSGRGDTFNVKTHALLPVVNIARWAALGAGSTELQTTKRLRAAAGSEMLPNGHADRLIEVFDVLQRLRLRYQLSQISQGEAATDILERDRLSPIDRSVVAQAVREVAATQRRMDRVAVYDVDPRLWAIPRPNSADSPRKT